MRKQLLIGAVASAMSFGQSLPSSAQSAPQCASGFKLIEESGNRITCLKNSIVESAEEAERIANGLRRKANCIGGRVSENQAGIGEDGVGAFLVTVRFACTGN
ncbi:MAG: hypothetical protein R3D57_13145 [Hyphomicrobiaceae bacterium]